ncbi:hypothetical protein F4820DRAFT_404368 [Hypoxylon rubiginosum]|uniref:Uncharacterized protein n=1 Tax=Hypoxylon rubiginosum TaxID=110542 RepID=A0ACB9ZF12_9PEZI|nr:hypothetical protein F4820DRAFT_404368 [Hypoxylon rubiginosum]
MNSPLPPQEDAVADFLNHIKNSAPKKKFPNLEPSDATAAAARQKVYELYKRKVPNFDAASGDLAPVFGLGDSSDDLLARQRAQGLFTHPAFVDAYVEFAEAYLAGRWDLPAGEWAAVHKLFHVHRRNPEWSRPDACPSREGWDVNHFYARFVIRAQHGITQKPSEVGGGAKHMAWWLQGATACDACFVLLHALLYLQLETMRDYRKHAPAKDRISHIVGAWKAKMAAGPKE